MNYKILKPIEHDTMTIICVGGKEHHVLGKQILVNPKHCGLPGVLYFVFQLLDPFCNNCLFLKKRHTKLWKEFTADQFYFILVSFT